MPPQGEQVCRREGKARPVAVQHLSRIYARGDVHGMIKPPNLSFHPPSTMLDGTSAMAINWTAEQRPRVATLLARHPASSGRCADLARQLCPIALELDPTSKVWRLEPAEGRYIVPKVKLEAPWFFHVTTETAAHYIDALTDINGTPCEGYLAAHWTHTDAIVWSQETT